MLRLRMSLGIRCRGHRRGHAVANGGIVAVPPTNRGERQAATDGVGQSSWRSAPTPASTQLRPRDSSPRLIVSQVRIAASSRPSAAGADQSPGEWQRPPPTAPSRQSPDPGGSRASIPCPHRCPGAKSTCASSSRLSDGVSSTEAAIRSPLSPKVPSCPVAIRRAFSLGAAPEPSETTTSGPSSSQRSSGRLAAERSVQAQSSCLRVAPRAALPAATASLRRGVFRVRLTTVLRAHPHIFAQRGQKRGAHRLDRIAARKHGSEW